MFEQIKSEIGDMPIKIEYLNGRVKYGVIIDYILKEKINISNWKFIAYSNLNTYEKTEDPKLIENLEEKNIASIDILLK